MRINAIHIDNESQLLVDYREHKTEAMQFFDYEPYQSLENRITDLKERDFKRAELSEVLLECNRHWGASDATLKNIEALKNNDTVAVVGGQQAGLLTGPLYSLNKVISIIQFAKQQEEILQVPVVPIFWIAGEDHDYEEINHVYMPESTQLKKVKLKQSHYKKTSVSQIELDQNVCRKWLDHLFSTLEETKHTKVLYQQTLETLESSINFTEFFAKLILELFQEEGLILIDAADKQVRELESDYFLQMIENQPKISLEVVQAAEKLKDNNYALNLEVDLTDGHLFYQLEEERILLERSEAGKWVGKQNEVELTTEELLIIARDNPEKLSNNVVTRPLMQEFLIPTLAFIGGPGEISYWAALKKAFHVVDLKMPPVLPRLSYSYIPNRVTKALESTGIDIETAINNGVEDLRKTWLENKQQPGIEQLADELKKTIEKAHEPMRGIASEIRVDIEKLAEKNLFYLHKEVDFLRDRMNQALEMKYDQELSQFDLIQMMLRPHDGFQERKWNPLPFLNLYGKDFITQVTKYPVSFSEKHYAVYL